MHVPLYIYTYRASLASGRFSKLELPAAAIILFLHAAEGLGVIMCARQGQLLQLIISPAPAAQTAPAASEPVLNLFD